jgi:predicted DNA-binding transcriptional regulator AlpA
MPNSRPRNTLEAAEKLGVRPCTLEAWRHRGGGPKYVKFGRAVRYYDNDLDQFIESRTRTSTSDERGAA